MDKLAALEPGWSLRVATESRDLAVHLLTAAKRILGFSNLYHTTSLFGLHGILKSGKLKPHSYDFPYVSFSETPFTGDIRGNDAVIVFDSATIPAMKVKYTEDWYEEHREQAAYIAGEGWREQYVIPDDCFDDEGWEDEDCVEEDERLAEMDAFMDKSREREWISLNEGPVPFSPRAVVKVLAVRSSHVEPIRETLTELGYDVPVETL